MKKLNTDTPIRALTLKHLLGCGWAIGKIGMDVHIHNHNIDTHNLWWFRIAPRLH